MVIIGEVGVLLFIVLLYVVPTELTEYTEAYGLKLLESTEWPTLREAGIHRTEGCTWNGDDHDSYRTDCLFSVAFGDASYQFCAFCRMTRSVYTVCGFQRLKPVGFCVFCAFRGN